jgi:hypothetical protein
MRALVVLVLGLVLGSPQLSHAAPRRPTSVLAKITLGSPAGLDGVRTFASSIKPGAGAMLSTEFLVTQATGMSLDGLDTTGPVHVLYVDTPAAQGFAVVARVADPKLLPAGTATKNHWAIVGDKPLVRQVRRWAFATLDVTSVPPELVATIYPGAVLRRYKQDIAATRKASTIAAAGLPPGIMDSYWDMLLGFANDTEQLEIRVDVDTAVIGVDLAFVPKRRTRLARFVRLQKPSQFELLARLPASTSIMIGAGRLVFGPYRKGMLEMISQVYAELGGPKLAPAISTLLDAMSGDVAMAAAFDAKTGMALDALYALDDARRADAAIAKLIALVAKPTSFTLGEVTTTTQAVAGTTQHAGATIRAYDTTTTGGPPNPLMPKGTSRSQLAVLDDVLVFVTDHSMPRAIDAARGKGAHLEPTAAQTKLLDRARHRHDSFVFTMDLGALMKAMATPTQLPADSNLMFSLGFTGGAAHLYFALPTQIVRSLANGAP